MNPQNIVNGDLL